MLRPSEAEAVCLFHTHPLTYFSRGGVIHLLGRDVYLGRAELGRGTNETERRRCNLRRERERGQNSFMPIRWEYRKEEIHEVRNRKEGRKSIYKLRRRKQKRREGGQDSKERLEYTLPACNGMQWSATHFGVPDIQ